MLSNFDSLDSMDIMFLKVTKGSPLLYGLVFPIEPNSQDLWSLGWVSLYMTHDSIDFSPIPLNVF